MMHNTKSLRPVGHELRMSARILLVEDDPKLARSLRRGLEEEGFAVDWAADGEQADHAVTCTRYDAVILDLMLPKLDGLSLIRDWRERGLGMNILVVSACGSLHDRVRGLDLGADDYLPKPFALEELLARVRALVRRQAGRDSQVLRVHDLEIDLTLRVARRGGQEIRLTPREFLLLEYLARHRGKVLTRAMIWNRLYDQNEECTSNVIDVYIRYLRNKIDRGFDLPLILTRWGEGYMMRGDEPASGESKDRGL